MGLTAQEVEERKKFLGGSDAAAILGLSNYKTPLILFYEKTGVIQLEVEQETEAQEWGKRLEPAIRQKFEDVHGVKAPELNAVVHLLAPFIRVNLDGFVESENMVAEFKNSSEYMGHVWKDENGNPEIPSEYMCQIAINVSAKMADGSYLGALIGGNKYREFVYSKDDEFESLILDAYLNFWCCVKNLTPPEAICIDDLRIKYKRTDPDKQVKIIPELNNHLNSISTLKERIKEMEKEQEKAKMQIMEYMKDCELLTDDEGLTLASWKANKKGTRVFLLRGDAR